MNIRHSIAAGCMAAVFLGVAGVASGAPASAVDRLPAAPPVTDAADQQPSLDITHLSANGSVDLKTGQVRRSLSLQGRFHFPPGPADAPGDGEVVAVSHQVELKELLGDDGHDLLKTNDDPAAPRPRRPGGARFYSAVSNLGEPGARPVHISTSLPDIAQMPPRFKSIRGTGYALLARKRLTHDISPVTPGGPADLSTGLMVKITAVTHENGTCAVEFDFESEAARPFFTPSNSPPFILSATLIDDQDRPQRHRGWSSSTRTAEHGIHRGEGRLNFPLAQDRQPKALRFDVVTAVEEIAVDFHLKDVPGPLGDGKPPE